MTENQIKQVKASLTDILEVKPVDSPGEISFHKDQLTTSDIVEMADLIGSATVEMKAKRSGTGITVTISNRP